MKIEVQKWDDSLALRIPQAFADQLGVVQGSEVELVLVAGGLLIRPATRRYPLAELLKQVTQANLHGEVRTSEKMGREEG